MRKKGIAKNIAIKMFYDPQTTESKWVTRLKNIAKVITVLLVTILLAELLRRLGLGDQSLLMLFLLSVLVISIFTPSYSYGITAAVVCTLAYDFFIAEPRFGFSFSFTLGFPITLLSMLLVTFLTSTLIIQAKKQAQKAVARERRAELLYELNQTLGSTESSQAVVELTNEYIQEYLERPAAFYTADPKESSDHVSYNISDPQEQAIFQKEDEIKRVHRYFLNKADRLEEDGLEPGDIHYEPVLSRDKVIGAIGIDCRKKPLSSHSRTFMQIMAAQVGHALELHSMSEKQSSLMIKAEREKMRSTLLRSISHDLRTPLTSIQGASSAILEQQDMPEKMRNQLVADIRENAGWLIRMVENILTVTRISKETMELHKTMEAAEEVISQAVSIVRKRFPDCLIHIRIPEEFIEIPMDVTLVSQVIINLLENAVKNSEEGALVLVNLKKKDGFAVFEVRDHGHGIPEHLLDNLFEIHTQHEEQSVDSTRGIGIGLSICQTIIQAHGGVIEGRNREEGGAKFRFTLPLEETEDADQGDQDQDTDY